MVIGNTPLIKLSRLSEPGAATIYLKYEAGNPTGSMKDRILGAGKNIVTVGIDSGLKYLSSDLYR